MTCKGTNSKKTFTTLKIQHWISKFGPRQYLITAKGTENPNSEMAYRCTVFSYRHSPGISDTFWTNGLLEVKNILEPICERFFNIALTIGLF